MNLAVSNIAWSPALDAEVFTVLEQLGVTELEVAPTRLWPDWDGAGPESAARWKERLRCSGFLVPSLQAIVFAKPSAKLLGTEAERAELAEHLRLCAELALWLGASSLVFGGPKNRDRGSLSREVAFDMAAELLREVARYYAERDVCLCLEANPPQYGCTFVTNSEEAAALVRRVDSPGLRLHLDTACMYLAGEDLPAAIARERDILRHFHVSEPNLGTFERPVIDHEGVAAALAGSGYEGWVSLEMREAGEHPLAAVEQAVRFVQSVYGRGL